MKRVYWENVEVEVNKVAPYFLNTAISFSRLRSLFCFFFTHFMANSLSVFLSLTMYTSEKAPLSESTRTNTLSTDLLPTQQPAASLLGDALHSR